MGFRGVIFTCNAVAWPPPILKWRSEQTREEISFKTNTSGLFHSASLQFNNGFSVADAGRYTCVLEGVNSDLSRSFTITLVTASELVAELPPAKCVATEFFQIRVLDTDCSEWSDDDKEESRNTLSNALVGGILSQQCSGCSVIERSTVTLLLPTCSTLIPRGAVFKGQILTEDRTITQNIYCALSEWLQLDPLLNISGNFIQADHTCPFMLSSRTECSLASGTPLTLIIAGSSAGVFLPLFIFITTLVICSYLRYASNARQCMQWIYYCIGTGSLALSIFSFQAFFIKHYTKPSAYISLYKPLPLINYLHLVSLTPFCPLS